jgi:hypothetical protein
MQLARNRANTERQKSTPIPIPTPTPKEAVTGNRQPPEEGDGIPRLSAAVCAGARNEWGASQRVRRSVDDEVCDEVCDEA